MKKIYFLLFALIGGVWLNAQTFSSATPILGPGTVSGTFAPYPSDITVTGVGNIGSVSVTLFDVSHTFAADFEILLVGPTGATSILMSDAGGAADYTNDTVTFATGGAPFAVGSGTFAPTGTAFTGGGSAPAGPYTADLSVFDFTNADGVWSLYVYDDAGGDAGDIAAGWSVTFTPPPSCIPPTGLSASPLATSATLNWNIGSAGTHQIEWDLAGFTAGTGANSGATAANTINAPALTPATTYDFFVRTICGPGDTSTWTGPFTFSTPCVPYIAPYTESFDAAPLDICASLSAVSGGPWRLGVNFTWNSCATPVDHTGNGGSFISNDMSTPDAGVVYQLNDVDVSALTTPYLDLYHYMCGTYNNEVYVEAWDGAAWAQVGLINTPSPNWENYGYDLSTFTFGANLVRVRFRLEEGTTGTGSQFNSDVALDDISIIEAPTCFIPVNLASTNVTDVSADVSWTETFTATMWEVQYDTTGFVLGTGNSVYPSGTPDTTLSGLADLTTYDFFVRAICGPGDTSDWSAVSSFTTELMALNCPPGTGAPFAIYQTSFEDPGCTGSSNWLGFEGFTQLATGTAGAWRRECSGATGSGWIDVGPLDGDDYAYFETTSATGSNTSDTLTSPTLDISTLSGGARATGYFVNGGNSTFIVERSLDGGPWTNVITDNGLGGGSAPDLGEWTLFVDDFSAAVGTASTIAWRFIGVSSGVTNGGDIGLDLLTVEACVSCLPPTNTTVSVLGPDSAVVEFDVYGGANAAFIEYGPAPLTPGSGTTIISMMDSVVLSGLLANTEYDVYVSSDCSASTGDSSTLDGPYSFTTPCLAIFPSPFCDNFDSWSTGSFGPNINTCWSAVSTVNPRWQVNSGSTTSTNTGPNQDASGSGNYVYLETSTPSGLGDTDTLITPAVDVSALALPLLTFQYHMYGADINELQVWVEDVNTGVNTLVSNIVGEQQTANGEAWRTQNVYLFDYVGDTIIVRFVGIAGASFDGDIALDEFCLQESPTCPDPYQVSVDSVSAEEVYVSWDVPYGTPNFEVEAVEAGQAQGTGVVVTTTDTFAVVTGLTPDTDYDFFVRGVCSATDSSNWVQIGSATTLHLNEIGVTSITSPTAGCGLAATPLTIVVENFGVANLLYTPVVVQLSGDFSGIYTLVLDTLNGGAVDTIVLDSLNTLAGGTLNVTAFTNLANDEDMSNDTSFATIEFGMVPAAPAIGNMMACEGDSLTIGFASIGELSWYDSDTATSPLYVGDTLTMLAADTTFYVGQQVTYSGTATLDMFDTFGDGWNGHSLAVSVNGVPVIGSPFTLGGGSFGQETFQLGNGDLLTLEMFSGGFQSEVGYSITDTLGNVIFADGANVGTLVTYGVVFDEVVTIAGCPSDLTMFQVSTNPTYLDTVVLTACDSMMVAGMVQTASGFYTDSLSSVSGCDSVVVFDLTINNSYAEARTAVICDNGSFTLPDGVVVNTAGTYTSVLTAANGCDSVITYDISVVSSFELTQDLEACEGDTVFVGTSAYTATGMYVDSLLSVDGCDSVVTTNLLVYPTVDVTIGGVTVVCENAPAVDLTLDPLGGVLSGPGVTGSTFDPAAAGLGVSTLTYTFADGNGCDATASLDVEVVVCTGIEDIEGIETLSIYPNPYISTINLLFDDAVAGELNITLFDVTGRVLMSELVKTSVGANTISLEVSPEVASGVHFLQIERDGAVYSTTIIKK